ncbi:hypothetical protein PANT_10d00115 [Moesziomyces antarcticus T-34]|uniref:K Homology domain-containing protein n=1 Tax=Pseudozyma antarctica (strain T-34) TaxID=1151754 RepID=M9LPX1_PSEA3|nr:hypothetical protein PANT_10d00115 [Moesziomyces antarcticus T-34]
MGSTSSSSTQHRSRSRSSSPLITTTTTTTTAFTVFTAVSFLTRTTSATTSATSPSDTSRPRPPTPILDLIRIPLVLFSPSTHLCRRLIRTPFAPATTTLFYSHTSTMSAAPVAENKPEAPNASAPPLVDAANLRTQNISIPSDMVGCIIGKGGSKITEIRRLSGSRISIAKVPHDETGERMFTIQGTPEANEKALFLLYNQLETEKERRQKQGTNGAADEDTQATNAAAPATSA